MNTKIIKDLIVIVADQDMEFTLRELLETRHHDLCMRKIKFDIYRLQHDSNCFKNCDSFLRQYHHEYSYALVLFDYQGSGQEKKRIEEVEADVRHRVSISGWNERIEAIVIAPELESWVWSRSVVVEDILGWKSPHETLWECLARRGLLKRGEAKPHDPKKAMMDIMRLTRKRKSASIFQELAAHIQFDDCQDRSFLKMKYLLSRWFPSEIP